MVVLTVNISFNCIVLGTAPLKIKVVVPFVPVLGKTTAPLANGTVAVGIEMRRGAVVVLVKFNPLLGTGFVIWLMSRCCKTGKFCRALA